MLASRKGQFAVFFVRLYKVLILFKLNFVVFWCLAMDLDR
jgi:hypothetical protein